jgi:HK97 family phage major capsid protein
MAPTIAIPQTGEELREMLTDRKVMAQLIREPELMGEFIENSVNARLKRDPSISAQVNEQTEAFMIEWLRENGMKNDSSIARRLNLDSPNMRARVRPNTLYNKNALGAKHDAFFNAPSDFFYAISDHVHKDTELSKRLGVLKNDLSSVKPSDGGYLIPEILRAELLRVALESAIVRSRARVIPMDSLTVPFPTVDSTSNVSSVYGGVIGYWTEEGATLTASQPRFGRVELRANKLVLYTEVPNELMQDAKPSMEAFINDIFPEAISWFEDVAFFVGGGVGEPLGFLNAPSAISVTRSTTVAGTNVEWVDIVNMYARMLPQSLSRAVWVVSPDVLPSLLTMTVANGTNAVLLGGGGFASGSVAPPMSILGIPMIVSEKARAVGTAGDINLVDFGFYLIGDRQAMSARQSEEFKFDEDVTAFRVIERLDGRPWLNSAITPQNNGSTLSPFVKLTTSV